MEGRDGVGYADNNYMYYGQDVDPGTNFTGSNTNGINGIKEETAR